MIDACKPAASIWAFAAAAPGKTKIGFTLDISAKNGIGRGRACATRHSATPPEREPVKAPAMIGGCFTRATPTSKPVSNNIENTPAGNAHSWTAALTTLPTRAEVSGCAGWAFTITGQPTAKAEAVSPPATEKASGKLLAPKTTTGPRGTNRERILGFG